MSLIDLLADHIGETYNTLVGSPKVTNTKKAFGSSLPVRYGNQLADRFQNSMATATDPNLPYWQKTDATMGLAGLAMTGGMPGIPRGTTTGMAFRLPKDVVITTRGQTVPGELDGSFSPYVKALHALVSRYQNKQWGTVNDPVIAHIDAGYMVPDIPGLDAAFLNRNIDYFSHQDVPLDVLLNAPPEGALAHSDLGVPLSAKTPLGQLVEVERDFKMLGSNALSNDILMPYARGLSDNTKAYLKLNSDAKLFARPDTSPVAMQEMSYTIDGNLDRMSMADLLLHATKKEEALAKAALGRDERLYTFEDGSYWTPLKTQLQRNFESDAMGNSARLPMHDGKNLYSYRDRNGKSILTASNIKGDKAFNEIKTRFNRDDILESYNAQEPTPYDIQIEVLGRLLGWW